ncbi:MAG: hypothetical protein AB7S26_00020 [Sandaracinaceae bacterium]
MREHRLALAIVAMFAAYAVAPLTSAEPTSVRTASASGATPSSRAIPRRPIAARFAELELANPVAWRAELPHVDPPHEPGPPRAPECVATESSDDAPSDELPVGSAPGTEHPRILAHAGGGRIERARLSAGSAPQPALLSGRGPPAV